jgi:hypothetical protein
MGTKRLDPHGDVVASSPHSVLISTCSSSGDEAPTGEATMDMIGIDLHKRESQRCTLSPDGNATEQRIVTSRERFTAMFGNRAPVWILLEATRESACVAQCLEALGHERSDGSDACVSIGRTIPGQIDGGVCSV